MSKRSKKKKSARKRLPAVKPKRNESLDTLRGIAIVLMIVDHASWLFFDPSIVAPSISESSIFPILPVRFFTRLSMPLFCGLLGYFLASKKKINWQRVVQVALATVAINLYYYTVYERVEILASLLVCLLIFTLIGNWFMCLLLAFLVFPHDPSVAWFDYPLSVVACCVAQGMILRVFGAKIGALTSIILLLGCYFVTPPTQYVLFFAPVATGLIALGAAHPSIKLTWLALLGRYPLTAYLSQYFVLLTLSRQFG